VSINPRLLVSPQTGGVGDTITVAGFGFAAGEQIGVKWLSPQTLLATATADRNGSFPAVSFAIPTGSTLGNNLLIATGQKSGATASSRIVVH
jgi:hypothetical protein